MLAARVRRSEPYVWLLPAVLFFAVFFVYPLILGARLAFTSWSGFTPIDQAQSVGFANFSFISQDPVFWLVLENSVVWAIATTALFTLFGFVLAFALWYHAPRGAGLLRSLIFYPVVLSTVIVSLAWFRIYDVDGLLNSVLGVFSSQAAEVYWLANTKLAFWAVMWTVVWQGTGFTMILMLAGMSSISKELLDAALIDGADSFQVARHVVWPLIRYATAITILVNFVSGLQVFGPMWVMTQGGPENSTATLGTYSFQQAFQFGHFGYAAAITMVGVVILSIFAVARIRASDVL